MAVVYLRRRVGGDSGRVWGGARERGAEERCEALGDEGARAQRKCVCVYRSGGDVARMSVQVQVQECGERFTADAPLQPTLGSAT